MSYLLDLPELTPEIAKAEGIQPFAGLRIVDLVEKNPSEKAKLLSTKPRVLTTKFGKKGVFIFSFLGKEFGLKFATIRDTSTLSEGQEFNLKIEQAEIEGKETKWCVAV